MCPRHVRSYHRRPLRLAHPRRTFSNVLQLAATGGTLYEVPLAEWERRDSTDEVCYIDGAYYPHVAPALARAG